MNLKKVAGTKVRGNAYHLNLRIPQELQDIYDGKTHIRRSLKTCDPLLAENAVTLQKAEFLKKELEVQNKQGVQALIDNLRPDQRKIYNEAGGLEGLINRQQATDIALAFAHLGGEAETGQPIDDDEISMQHAIDTAAFETLTKQSKRDAKVLNDLGMKIDIKDETLGLYDLAKIYLEAKNLAPQTKEAYHYVIRRFTELNGDHPVDELNIQQLREFSNEVVKLPANASAKEIRGLEFKDAIIVAESSGMPRLCGSTRDKYLSKLKSLTAFAVPQGYMQSDPWHAFKVIKPKERYSLQKKKRNPFTPDEIDCILKQAEKYNLHTIDRWAPILTCYQGARREEIGQLRGRDILMIDGVWCMQITDVDHAQKLKNASSFRTIPLHPKLIEAGFVSFAKSQEAASFLFQEQERWSGKLKSMKLDSRGRLTEAYGKRFSRMLREKLKIEDDTLVFHSFRHSWEDAAEASGIPDTHRKKISGRSVGNDSQAGYGNGPSIKDLYDSLSKIDPMSLA